MKKVVFVSESGCEAVDIMIGDIIEFANGKPITINWSEKADLFEAKGIESEHLKYVTLTREE